MKVTPKRLREYIVDRQLALRAALTEIESIGKYALEGCALASALDSAATMLLALGSELETLLSHFDDEEDVKPAKDLADLVE